MIKFWEYFKHYTSNQTAYKFIAEWERGYLKETGCENVTHKLSVKRNGEQLIYTITFKTDNFNVCYRVPEDLKADEHKLFLIKANQLAKEKYQKEYGRRKQS